MSSPRCDAAREREPRRGVGFAWGGAGAMAPSLSRLKSADLGERLDRLGRHERRRLGVRARGHLARGGGGRRLAVDAAHEMIARFFGPPRGVAGARRPARPRLRELSSSRGSIWSCRLLPARASRAPRPSASARAARTRGRGPPLPLHCMGPPPFAVRPAAHPSLLLRRSSLTGSSRGVYKRNGESIAIPHKTNTGSWKLNEAMRGRGELHRRARSRASAARSRPRRRSELAPPLASSRAPPPPGRVLSRAARVRSAAR